MDYYAILSVVRLVGLLGVFLSLTVFWPRCKHEPRYAFLFAASALIFSASVGIRQLFLAPFGQKSLVPILFFAAITAIVGIWMLTRCFALLGVTEKK